MKLLNACQSWIKPASSHTSFEKLLQTPVSTADRYFQIDETTQATSNQMLLTPQAQAILKRARQTQALIESLAQRQADES